MRKKIFKRLYPFSDAELIILCNQKIAFLYRDVNAFADFGITTEIVNDFKKKVHAFSEIPTDLELLAHQTEATEKKNAKAEEIKVVIKNIMLRVALQFSNDSSIHRKFNASATATLSDANLLLTAKRVVHVATELLKELSKSGLTSEYIDQLNTMINEFVVLLIAIDVNVGERENAQEKRVEAGNTIYTLLMKFSKMGQTIWESLSTAKYNDYIVYHT